MKYVILGIIFSIAIVSGIAPVFAEASYETLFNRFYNQPIVCIYEPGVPNARDVIIDAWLKETELGVKFWQYDLQQSEYNKKDKWNIETQIISLEDQLYFDNKDCDVDIRFDATDLDGGYAGVHWFDGERIQIRIVYTDKEVCRTWTDEYYRYTEWCFKEDYTRSKAIGNIATHELGHAIGLEHYESDDPYENYEWSVDPYASPSIMTLAVHYDEDRNKIRQIDIDKVKEIYDYHGFGDPKPTTLQEYPTFETKNLGGFESFSSSSSEYFKESGKISYVTISGKVTESAYSKRQNIILKVTLPDGHEEEMKSMALENRVFSFQIRIDKNTPTGEYTLNAQFRNYDSQTLTFSVLDSSSKPIPKIIPNPTVKLIPETKEEIKIPTWLKNNAKWWSEGTIDDKSFSQGIEFLISNEVIDVSITEKTTSGSNEIPLWVRTNANWWADGLILDSEFVRGIEYLVNGGIIQVQR